MLIHSDNPIRPSAASQPEPAPHALAAIGNTSLVALRRVVPMGCARIVVKVEGENPTGSMKDRVALAMIGGAEAEGRLNPGITVVEYTGGSTGASLALVCGVRGYRLHLVSSDAFSEEKLRQMVAFGAELTVIPSEGRGITRDLIRAMIDRAAELGRKGDTLWTDQLNNRHSEVGYHRLGEEIWSQTAGQVDGFVQSVGTSHSLRGAAIALRRRSPLVQVVAVEPAESPVLSGGTPGSHGIEGIGIGATPPMWDPSIVNAVETVTTVDAEAMARRLAREEGLFAGTSSGANVVAAIRLGLRLGPSATVATLLVDNGLKYITTKLYQRSGGGDP